MHSVQVYFALSAFSCWMLRLSLFPSSVVGAHEAADPVLGARDPDDDLVIDDEGRERLAVARLGVGDLDVPVHLARLGVERDGARIEGGHVDAAVSGSNADGRAGLE